MQKSETNENSVQDAFIDDELLECIWVTAEEQGTVTTELLYEKFGKETVGVVLSEMVGKNLITIHDSVVLLTETGAEEGNAYHQTSSAGREITK